MKNLPIEAEVPIEVEESPENPENLELKVKKVVTEEEAPTEEEVKAEAEVRDSLEMEKTKLTLMIAKSMNHSNMVPTIKNNTKDILVLLDPNTLMRERVELAEEEKLLRMEAAKLTGEMPLRKLELTPTSLLKVSIKSHQQKLPRQKVKKPLMLSLTLQLLHLMPLKQQKKATLKNSQKPKRFPKLLTSTNRARLLRNISLPRRRQLPGRKSDKSKRPRKLTSRRLKAPRSKLRPSSTN